MNNKLTYIRAILVVFGLLILSRIPILVTANVDSITLISTLVELVFFVWGVFLLLKK